MGNSIHHSTAADPGPGARATPAASPGMTDAARGASCPQDTRQPEAEIGTVRTTGDTGPTEAGGQRTTQTADDPPVVVYGERTEGAAGNAKPLQPATAEERAHPGATTTPAEEGMHGDPTPGASMTGDMLASIFDETTPMAGQGPLTDWHLNDNESFDASMASGRDGAPTTGRQPHLRQGIQRHAGGSLSLCGTLTLHLTRQIFAATMPPWGRWPPSTLPPQGRLCRKAANGGG